ncbi:MAG: hypothetical protein KC431_30545, partial [Myxococcales bacterium]|nr:hypothetical protein [Myxococcales bacterium]
LIPALREAELLRVRLGTGNESTATLETAHDRIREVTVGELEPERLRETHLAIAQALERLASDPESLAEHFERGGERAKAADYFERAAEQAANSLAFQRAVALFRRTIDLLEQVGDPDPARVTDLRSGLAEQLINIGRGHEAAQMLLALAEHTERAEPARAREYRRLAADQLIKTGHVDEGLAELDKLLRTVGMRLPAGKAASISALVWEQTRLRMRGFEFIERPASEVEPEILDQIDTCFAVVNGLSTQEVLLSVTFHLRNLRLSLTAGEPRRVARSLAYQCVIEVAGRDWRLVEEHLRVARELAARVDDPELNAFIDVCEASVHWFERRFPISTRLHTKILETSEGVAGAVWERRTAHAHHMWTLVCKGRFKEFRIWARGAIGRARERGDMQEMIEVSAFESVALVLTGDPDGAQRILAEALADWKPGRYLFGDVWCFYGQARALIWKQEPEQAVALAKETLAQMARTFLDQNALARHNVQELLCRGHLAAALLRESTGHARRAKRIASRLRSQDNPVLTAQVAVIEAGLASLAGDRQTAIDRWCEAEKLFIAHDMAGSAAAVRMRMAQVYGEEGEGPRLAEDALLYFESEDILHPEVVDGFLRVIAPARMDKLGVVRK